MDLLSQIKEFVVPQDIANKVENFVCDTGSLHYKRVNQTISSEYKNTLNETINLDSKQIDGINIRDSYYFAKLIVVPNSKEMQNNENYDPKNRIADPDSFVHFKDLQDYIAINIIEKPVTVQLFRINCFTQMFNDDSIPTPHLDVDVKYVNNPGRVSVLYYINDSTGDTHFFDTNTKKLIKTVSPKKGTGVMFNPTILHAGKFPNTHIPRFVAYILCSF